MTIKQLAKEICKREGLKKQVDIAQVTEIIGHVADIFWPEYLNFDMGSDPKKYTYLNLVYLGQKREKKKLKKK